MEVCLMEEKEIEGGWIVIRGEKRFKPLRTKRVPHCISCLFFNKQYQSCSRGHYTWEDAEACDEYLNRTHWREKFE
jgi:hypothetical protein